MYVDSTSFSFSVVEKNGLRRIAGSVSWSMVHFLIFFVFSSFTLPAVIYHHVQRQVVDQTFVPVSQISAHDGGGGDDDALHPLRHNSKN